MPDTKSHGEDTEAEKARRKKEIEDFWRRQGLRHVGVPTDLLDAAMEMGLMIAEPSGKLRTHGHTTYAVALNLSDGERSIRMDIRNGVKGDEFWWSQRLIWLRAAKECAERGEPLPEVPHDDDD